MKTREKRERLLVGLYHQAKKAGFDSYIDANALADQLGLESAAGEIRSWTKELETYRYVAGRYTLAGGVSVRLTARGSEEAEELLEKHPEYSSSDEGIRYVTSSAITFDDSQDLTSLAALVRSSNAGSDFERTEALAEIAVFEAAVQQPVIATDLIDRFVNWVLKWIASKFPDAVIQTVIAAIIVRLVPFLAT
jgi:hypothetical protein